MITLETLVIILSFSFWVFALIQGLILKKKMMWGSYAALIIHFGVILFRLIAAGHLPFANIYESLIFFSFLYGLKVVFIFRKRERISSWLLLPTLILLLFAILMPTSQKNPSELMPALKSIWFYFHVPSIFIGYVSITFAFLLSFFKKGDASELMESEIKIGFFFLSAGIITGAFWGAQSWSQFWNWDPKEVWALITWLLLVGVLHIKNSKGKRALLYLSFGALLFTYFGVTYILPGLHSYGG